MKKILKEGRGKKIHAKERNKINIKTDFLSKSIKAKRR